MAGDLRSFLGRWAVKGSTDTYVRTAVRVVENLQLLAVRHARCSASFGPDYYGEEHILRNFLDFCMKAGEPQESKAPCQLSAAATSPARGHGSAEDGGSSPPGRPSGHNRGTWGRGPAAMAAEVDAESEGPALQAARIDSVAVGLLHAYANPAHEQRVAAII